MALSLFAQIRNRSFGNFHDTLNLLVPIQKEAPESAPKKVVA